MAHMLGTQAETGEDQRKGVVRSLRQKLARLRRQLRDINNDVGALGDDPYDMGAAFIAEGGGSSDDECVGSVPPRRAPERLAMRVRIGHTVTR